MCHITLPAIHLSKKLVERNSWGLQPSPCVACTVLSCFTKPCGMPPFTEVGTHQRHVQSAIQGICVWHFMYLLTLSFRFGEHLSWYCSYQPHAWFRIQIKPGHCLCRKCTLASLRFKVKVWFGHLSRVVWKCKSGASATWPDWDPALFRHFLLWTPTALLKPPNSAFTWSLSFSTSVYCDFLFFFFFFLTLFIAPWD